MRKLFAVLLILTLVLPIGAMAESQNTTPVGSEDEPYEGIYEGEYDTEGKRSGYGTWAYHSFLYVGQWANDLPNGEGTLYEHQVWGSDSGDFLIKITRQGNWVDGFADGPIEEKWATSSDRVLTFCYDVKDGRTTSDEPIVSVSGSASMGYGIDVVVAAIPPWNPILPDTTLPTPLPTFEFDDGAETLAGITHEIDDSAGIYEGEYDADGKRSGFGTWAYYNFLYVGNWENDMPNGEGTLYYREAAYREGEGRFTIDHMWHGNCVDGWPEGTVDFTILGLYLNQNGEELSYTFRINNVKRGTVEKDQLAMAINARETLPFLKDYFFGGVEPWARSHMSVSDEGDTPWSLYEMYPTGKIEHAFAKIENTGMGITPGNLANAGNGKRYQMAELDGWIFIGYEDYSKKETAYHLTKMRADGTQMMKLYEDKYNAVYYLKPEFQKVGDWLYVGSSHINHVVSDPYRMKAEDVEFTLDEGGTIRGLVVDDWVYEVSDVYDFQSQTYDYESATRILSKTKLDNSERIELSRFDIDTKIIDTEITNLDVIYADADWVYVYSANDSTLISPKEQVGQITRIKNDGSGRVETHLFRSGVGHPYLWSGMPQIAHGRMYYMEAYEGKLGVETSLYSVDLGFTEARITVIPRIADQHISYFHVTDDSIYYGQVFNTNGQGAIMRADLEGGNPTVLAGGFETGYDSMYSGWNQTGDLSNILIADDWMMFEERNRSRNTYDLYLMRLDGNDLHKASEPFIPSNTPGITDSTGMWRYELLEDGSAVILGAGSKLKQTGKLSIPATVDKIPVTAIGENAFYGCEDFTSLTIPKSVTSIGDFAFFWCKGLTGVTIPEGVTHIGEGAFQWCTKIKKATLPASLKSVGSQPFANCPTVKLSVAKSNETFAIVDGALFDKQQNRVVD